MYCFDHIWLLNDKEFPAAVEYMFVTPCLLVLLLLSLLIKQLFAVAISL